MSDLLLTGLDGSNPLGFLAALGALNVLSDRSGELPRPTLRWRTGDWRPMVNADAISSDQDLVEAVIADLATWKRDACLDLKYRKPKDREKENAKSSWDLKPPPEKFRSYLQGLLETAEPTSRRSIDFAAAFATEIARDNNENTKPTALHFTAGQQEFLAMVSELLGEVNESDVAEALFGPWRYARPLPVLGWDCTAARDYALRAVDPSKEKKRGVPGADWLAFRGLSFVRVAPLGTQILTTGCSGGWKDGRFRWPLWDVSLSRATVQVLMQLAGLDSLSDQERRARGISTVFASAIRRHDQGGRGSFAPSAAI